MTAQEWHDIKQRWFFAHLFEFQADAYRLNLEQRITQHGQVQYMVFVDGRFNGQWLLTECEERRRFCCQHSKPLLTPKEERLYKRLAKLDRKPYEKPAPFVWYEPYWRSFAAFKRQMLERNQVFDVRV